MSKIKGLVKQWPGYVLWYNDWLQFTLYQNRLQGSTVKTISMHTWLSGTFSDNMLAQVTLWIESKIPNMSPLINVCYIWGIFKPSKIQLSYGVQLKVKSIRLNANVEEWEERKNSKHLEGGNIQVNLVYKEKKLLDYCTKKRKHSFSILKALFSSDTRQSMKRRITTERWAEIYTRCG